MTPHGPLGVRRPGAPRCRLGAALALQEAEVAFGALLRRFPRPALAVDPDDLACELAPGHWRVRALPVRLWEARWGPRKHRGGNRCDHDAP